MEELSTVNQGGPEASWWDWGSVARRVWEELASVFTIFVGKVHVGTDIRQCWFGSWLVGFKQLLPGGGPVIMAGGPFPKLKSDYGIVNLYSSRSLRKAAAAMTGLRFCQV